jgi:RNA recognition motif-containing protein
MGRLKASTVETHELKERDLDEMYALFAEFYENTEKEKFLKDLLNKPKVILLRDKLDQSIKGFSTLKFFSIKIDERTINGLFSGDTVIDTHYRGTTALTMEFFKNIMGFKLRNPFKPLYWF